MADLSFLLNRTANRLDETYESRGRISFAKYLSISELGHPCSRYLYYIFRNYLPKPKVAGRVQRIFDTGHEQERRIIAGLQQFTLIGNCQAEVTACDGHLLGRIDAEILELPEAPATKHVAEFKSINDAGFKELKKHGVEKAKFLHYCQFQIYGYLRGLERFFYLAINKNDEDVYTERGEINKVFAEAQISRASRIIYADKPPERIGGKDSFDCKFCPAFDICHNGAAHVSGIRNDGTHRPSADGTWVKI